MTYLSDKKQDDVLIQDFKYQNLINESAAHQITDLFYSHMQVITIVLKFCIPDFSDKMAYANSAVPDQTAPLVFWEVKVYKLNIKVKVICM